MHRTNLRSIDLNLLVILQVLLEERNTTKTAQRLAMSQPAVSRALSRLRRLYDDPLLVRTPQGMEPTAKAQSLVAPLQQILRSVEQTLVPQQMLDPASVSGTLRIAAHSYVEYVILPGFIAQLQRKAPRLTLHIVPLDARYESQLDDGKVGMVISKFDDVPRRLHRLPLFQDQLICAASQHHPLAGQELDYRDYAAADHLLVAPRGSEGGILDDILAREGLRRHTQLIVQSFLAAPFILANSPLLLTAPQRILAPLMNALELAPIPTRFPLPSFAISLVRHHRDDNDPLLNWFTGELREWCQGLQAC